MTKSPKISSTNVEIKSTKRDRQAGFVELTAERIRERAKDEGVSYTAALNSLGIPSSTMANYWSGKRPWPIEYLSDLADLLSTNVDALLGRSVTNVATLQSVDAAEWVDVPEYDLRQMDDASKGPIVRSTQFRRDWLNRSFGRDRGLWLAKMPTDYPAQNLVAGDEVICCDTSKEELSERQLCIWRVPALGKLLVARYSMLYRANQIAVQEGEEYWANPHLVSGDLRNGEGADLIAVGRIVGRPLSPIR